MNLIMVAALATMSGTTVWWLRLTRKGHRAAEAQANRHMDLLVAENVSLKKAKEAAQAANTAKSRYLVGISHEIRSPLNAIYGYAQLLERESIIPAQEAGSVIRRSSEHLINIVDGLLDISRIESGILKLSRDIVPLPAFLESIVAMFRMQAQSRGLVFHYLPAANLPAFVRTDEKRLRQILINLLSNAIKYTARGSVSLIVRHGGLIAEIEVADTGPGIPAEEIDRIFEPFERGSTATASVQPGIGLGLAITRTLAQIMGGDVAVSSTPGVGSVFKLRLLLAEPGDAVVASSRRQAITDYVGRRRTILLIDDDPAQLAILQGLLRPLGFTVYAAGNGPDGIALAARCSPDLVLLDVQLPGMSGWDVATLLRAAVEVQPGEVGPTKILMVSANAHEFVAGGDGASAHDGFVTKPVDLEALLDTIAVLLGLAWQSSIAGAATEIARGPERVVAAARLAELRRLGQAGHVRGIEAALASLADDVPESHALVEQLRGHVRGFDLGGYLRLLDAHG